MFTQQYDASIKKENGNNGKVEAMFRWMGGCEPLLERQQFGEPAAQKVSSSEEDWKVREDERLQLVQATFERLNAEYPEEIGRVYQNPALVQKPKSKLSGVVDVLVETLKNALKKGTVGEVRELLESRAYDDLMNEEVIEGRTFAEWFAFLVKGAEEDLKKSRLLVHFGQPVDTRIGKNQDWGMLMGRGNVYNSYSQLILVGKETDQTQINSMVEDALNPDTMPALINKLRAMDEAYQAELNAQAAAVPVAHRMRPAG